MYDNMVIDFLNRYPNATVVEIGCGLNTRYERLDNGSAFWFEIDLPDVIALRKQFFSDTERRKMIGASVLDCDWHESIIEKPGPYLFISEAVLIYLTSKQVNSVIYQLTNHFDSGYLLFDTTTRKMVEQQGQHDAMKHLSKESWFRWECENPSQLEKWHPGFRLISSKTFVDADKSLLKKLPISYRIMCFGLPWLIRKLVGGYKINMAKWSE